MDKFFSKEGFHSENEYVEYVNMYLLTALSTMLYSVYGIVFALFTYQPFLIITQILSVATCIAAYAINRKRREAYAATIIMILLVSASINIWAYTLDVGVGLRWYAILALCPLYFFSSIKLREKIWLTVWVMFAFLTATIISYFRVPLVQMPNGAVFNTISCFVILASIAFELIIYKYVNTKRDDELARIGTILENIECGIVIVDAQTHTILDINSVAARMYGAEKEQLADRDCHNIICPAEKGACPVTDCNEIVHRSERELIRADGGTMPILKSVAKIWYNGREALLESFTDIADLKDAEEKLRSMEITERANRAKSEFLSRMSHEMRTPMNAIIGMTKIAESTDDVGRLKYCLSTIDVSSKHLLGIINDVLDMSKIEAGKFELDSAPLRIERILTKVRHLTTEPIQKKKIDFDVFFGKDSKRTYVGDELRLSQVVANLMSNAVKFTPTGGSIKLAVDEVRREGSSGVLLFSLEDTGIGMTQAQIDKLFNAFEQADGSITRQYGGTGLGLAISKSIIEKMDGRIWVSSTPGKGSTFSFEIKLPYAEPAEETVSAGEKLLRDFSNMSLLLVDDVEINREIFISLLEDTRARIDTAENGQDAVNKFRENPEKYDIIIMDIQMPLMNGYEATEQIRSLGTGKAKTIPIVAMSADAFKEDIEKCLASGMNDHLKKPIELELVLEKLALYSTTLPSLPMPTVTSASES